MRQSLALLVLVLGLAAAPLAAQEAAVLPEGVEPFAKTRDACFAAGEREAVGARIAAGRMPLAACPQGALPPRAEVDVSRVYKRRSGNIVDCASTRRREEAAQYMNAFLADVVAAAGDAADGAAGGAAGGPACAAAMLRSWAEADAMREVGVDAAANSSRSLRMFTYGGLSAAYLIHPEVRAAAGPDGDRAILGWFGRLAAGVEEDIARRRAEPREDNMQYWHAFALLPTALMTADAERLKESRRIFRAGMDAITADEADPRNDGFLPLELGRGDKALSYQAYAAQPLVALASLSQAYDCGFLRGRDRGPLVSLLSRTLEGRMDPQLFAEAQIRLGTRNRSSEQMRGAANGTPNLLYLVNRLDPRLYDRIDARVAEATGEARPVFSARRGAKAESDRLGGSYVRFADAAAALAEEPTPEGLKGPCGGK